MLPCYLELAIGESWVLKKPTVMVFGTTSHFCPVSPSVRLGTLIFSVHLLMLCTYSCWTILFTSVYRVFVSSDGLCLDVCLLAFGVCLFMTFFSRSWRDSPYRVPKFNSQHPNQVTHVFLQLQLGGSDISGLKGHRHSHTHAQTHTHAYH